MAVDNEDGERRQQGKDDEFENLEIVVDDDEEGQQAESSDGEGAGEERRAKTGGEDRDEEDKGKDDDDPNLTPEQKEKRKKRREERELRKRRREEERAELEELRATVRELKNGQQVLDRRATTQEYRRIEGALSEAKGQMDEAKKLVEEAKKAENWGAHAEALEAFFDSRDRVTRLTGMREQYVQRARQAEEQANQPSPEVERRARDWRSKNAWYDVNMRNEDSRIAAAIDEQLVADGFDPSSARYWTELDKRLAQRLPHRVKGKAQAEELDDDIDDESSPTSGSGRERVPGGKKVFHISKARLEALKEAGVDVTNKKEMAPYIKRFQQYDRENAKRGN